MLLLCLCIFELFALFGLFGYLYFHTVELKLLNRTLYDNKWEDSIPNNIDSINVAISHFRNLYNYSGFL